MLFSKADVKLDIKSSKNKSSNKNEKDQEDENIVKVKKVNLNNITNLIFEVSAKNSKEEGAVRVPNYVRTIIPEFFGLDDAESEEINGTVYKIKHIK